MQQQHPRQGVIYGVTNWKGGVGKTTTAFNIAAAAAALGLETLLVDLDPQGSSGIYAGLDPNTLDLTITERILRFTDKQVPRDERLIGFDEGIYRANGNLGFWVLPSSVELAGAESKLRDVSRREEVVKALLTPARERFDFIVLDSSSSLGELKKNMMVAADKLLIPVEAEFLAVRAMAPEIELIRDVIWDLNPSLQVAGVILTKVDRRNKLTSEMIGEITAHFAHLPPPIGAVPILGQIPRSVRVAESPQYGLSMLEYQPESPVTRAYREVVARLAAAEGWIVPVATEPIVAGTRGHHE
jgi:chromosome partitioning protein